MMLSASLGLAVSDTALLPQAASQVKSELKVTTVNAQFDLVELKVCFCLRLTLTIYIGAEEPQVQVRRVQNLRRIPTCHTLQPGARLALQFAL